MKMKLHFFIGTLIVCSGLVFTLGGCRDKPTGPAITQNGQAAAAAEDLLFEDASQLPAGLSFEGAFLQGARWQSPDATYWAAVSKHEEGAFFSPGWVSRLNIYLYEMRGEQLAGRTSFQVVAPNIYSVASLEGGKSQLANFSSIGKAFSIVYSICPDGEDPCSIYATVFNRSGKYDFQVQSGIDPAVYIDNRAVMMQGVPEEVQAHFLKQLFPGQ
jgi:hypothetical protein